MQSRRAILILILIVAGLFVLAGFTRPRLPETLVGGDNMAITQMYQLDTTVNDSLFIVAETVHLLENSHVTGDAAFISSDVTIEGEVDGDLTVTGEIVVLRPMARVHGDVTLIADRARIDGDVTGDIIFSGEQLVLAPDVQLTGNINLCSGEILEQRAGVVTEYGPCGNIDVVALVEGLRANVMLQSGAATLDTGARLAFALIATLFGAFALSAVSTLGVTLFPVQLSAMSQALRRPHSQLLTGLLTLLLLIGIGATVTVLLATIPALAVVLAPAAFVIGVIFLVLAAVGIIPIALTVGEWLLRRVSSAAWPPMVAATFGSLALALVVAVPVFVPYGALFSLAVGGLLAVVAVGTALNTRLGTRNRMRQYMVQG